MTLAICIHCGTEKFGAFVTCRKCGYQPLTLLDRAKSLMLSEHNFPPNELGVFGTNIRSGADVPYEPIALVICAEPIAEKDYYSQTLDNDDSLPCMRCQKLFVPSDEEVFCEDCQPAIDRAVATCTHCPALYDDAARFCQHCGATLTTMRSRLIAGDLAVSIGRLRQKQSPIDKSNFLSAVHRTLSGEKRYQADCELDIVRFYSAILVLHKFAPAQTIVEVIVAQVLDILRQSFVLSGMGSAEASEFANWYLKRFDEYDNAMRADQERWMIAVAGKAVENCYDLKDRDLGTTTDMVIAIGFYIKILTDILASGIRHRLKRA